MTLTSNTAANGLSHTFITPARVTEMLPGVTVQTLAMWRYRHTGPPYRKLGAKVVYALDELEEWVQAGAHGGEFDD